MNSWGQDREVEQVKAWAERAQTCIDHLTRDANAIRGVMGENCPLLHDLNKAKQLLREAIDRGVKGKEAA